MRRNILNDLLNKLIFEENIKKNKFNYALVLGYGYVKTRISLNRLKTDDHYLKILYHIINKYNHVSK